MENMTTFSPEAISYAWRQLAKRTGISPAENAITGFEELNLPVFYGSQESNPSKSPGLVISRCDVPSWHNILSAAQSSLDWRSPTEVAPVGTRLPFENSIPVLFWGKGYEDGSKPFAEQRPDGSVIFY